MKNIVLILLITKIKKPNFYMKKQLLLLAALSLSVIGASAQGFWVPQATGFPATSTGVFNVSVCDSATVWISAYDGSGGGADVRDFSTTIDGGATWIPGVVPAPAIVQIAQGLPVSARRRRRYTAVRRSRHRSEELRL